MGLPPGHTRAGRKPAAQSYRGWQLAATKAAAGPQDTMTLEETTDTAKGKGKSKGSKAPVSWLTTHLENSRLTEGDDGPLQEASQVTEERRQSKRAAKGSAAVTEEQELAAQAFPAAPTELDEDGTEYNAAAFCGPEEQWFAFVVHYPGDTYKAINDAKRLAKVAAWLKNAEITLGDVQLPDGTTKPRVIEPLVLKKQITAWNPRTDKMGKKAVVYANGDVLLFKAAMDNWLAWLIEKHSVDVSKKIDDRMELIAGTRPKSEKARAIKVTNMERWAASRTVHLRTGDSLVAPDQIFHTSADTDLLEDVMRNHMRRKRTHQLPLASPDIYEAAMKWETEKEVWDKQRVLQGTNPEAAVGPTAPSLGNGAAPPQAPAAAAAASAAPGAAPPASGHEAAPSNGAPSNGVQPTQEAADRASEALAQAPASGNGSAAAQGNGVPGSTRSERAVHATDRFAIAEAMLANEDVSPEGWYTSAPVQQQGIKKNRHKLQTDSHRERRQAAGLDSIDDAVAEPFRVQEAAELPAQPITSAPAGSTGGAARHAATEQGASRAEEEPAVSRELDGELAEPAERSAGPPALNREPAEPAERSVGPPALKGRGETLRAGKLQPARGRLDAGAGGLRAPEETSGAAGPPPFRGQGQDLKAARNRLTRQPEPDGPGAPMLRGRGQSLRDAKQLPHRRPEPLAPRPYAREARPAKPAERSWQEASWQGDEPGDDFAYDLEAAVRRQPAPPGGPAERASSAQPPAGSTTAREAAEEPMDDDAFFAELDRRLEANERARQAQPEPSARSSPAQGAGRQQDTWQQQPRQQGRQQPRQQGQQQPRQQQPADSDKGWHIFSRDDEPDPWQSTDSDASGSEPWLQGGFLDSAPTQQRPGRQQQQQQQQQQPTRRQQPDRDGARPRRDWQQGTYIPPDEDEFPAGLPARRGPEGWDDSAGRAAAEHYGRAAAGRGRNDTWRSFDADEPLDARSRPAPAGRPQQRGPQGYRARADSRQAPGGRRSPDGRGRGAERGSQAGRAEAAPRPIRTPRGDPDGQDQPGTPRGQPPANPFAMEPKDYADMNLDW